MRGMAHIEEIERQAVTASSSPRSPIQVNKTSLIERIAELVRERTAGDITDLRDESDRSGMSIIIELKRGAQPQTGAQPVV